MTQGLKQKLQIRPPICDFLIINAPEGFTLEGVPSFDSAPLKGSYDFIQIFGESIEELRSLCSAALPFLSHAGIFWVCYPKKSSKNFASDCSREKVWELVEGFTPVRQIAIDDDWTAMRLKKLA